MVTDTVLDRSAAAAQGMRLIDADAHIEPPYEMWRDYLPPALRDRAPYIEEGEDHDWIVFGESRRPLKMVGNKAGGTSRDFKLYGRRSEMRPVWNPEIRLQDMDQDGIDAAVLFGGGPLGTADPELFLASFEAYNRWVWDFAGANRKRLQPVGFLPMRDVDEAIAMLRDLAKQGFRIANIPAFPQRGFGLASSAGVSGGDIAKVLALTGDPDSERQYGDAHYDPFWAAAQELDMTITLHLGGRMPRLDQKQFFLADMLMSKLAMAEPLAIMIFNGVFARFPKLRLVSVESGVGWFAFAAEYMDRTWEKQRFWTGNELTEPPSFYMDRNVYGSFINDRGGILNRDLPGGRNIMWSSDYPHSETSFPHSRDVIARDFAGIPEADTREIVCDRARRVYFID